ncbi:pre-mrna-splicing factor slu7 [Gossypium australe]|uniref:Pre-mrna-splicing factor slu7 n=1 Tax=Gossypium australe TaxID=47621 RepID=A0A5B6WCW0_9ROSI|nr:pre-mrna-splicing factor slu7 [Gossypium australe]
MSRGGSVSRGGSRKRNETVARQSETRVPARTYLVWTRDEKDATEVVACIFLLFSTTVYTLIYPGSSHSMVLDCRKKKFSIQDKEGKVIEVRSVKTNGSNRIIS